ncbi:MAG: hypothetical protein LJE95_08190 [Acidobacteria bacterium]|nr:hypothetical protein [Acidobacteriota bacterium]
MMITLAAAVSAAVPAPHPPSGWSSVAKPDVYSASNLYGYIDGGAELFLEVGFENLHVYKLTRGSQELGVDMYRMNSPESALAIYLAKCAPETPVAGLGFRNSGDRFQLGILRGRYFILINNFEGGESLVAPMKQVAINLAKQIPSSPHPIPVPMPQQGLVTGSVRLVRGPFGLQPVYTLGDGDVLGLHSKRWAVVADYRADERTWTLIRVDYGTPSAATAAMAFLSAHLDPYLKVVNRRPKHLVFRDYAGQFGEAQTNGSLLSIRVHLKDQPTADGP